MCDNHGARLFDTTIAYEIVTERLWQLPGQYRASISMDQFQRGLKQSIVVITVSRPLKVMDDAVRLHMGV